ncbi:unnamed protein product [Brassica oleracea]
MQYLMPHFYAPWLNTYAEYLILLCFKTLKKLNLMFGCMTERSSPSGV